MATSTIKQPYNIITGYATAGTNVNIDLNIFFRSGNVVEFKLRMTATGNISANSTVCTLPWIPRQESWMVCDDGAVNQLYFNSDGTVQLREAVNSGNRIAYFYRGMYLAKN